MHVLALCLLLAAAHDAGVSPDARVPAWAPQLKPVDNLEGSYGLHKWGEGFYWDNPRFEARVAPDGTVSFKDKRGSVELAGAGLASRLRGKMPAPLPERTGQDPSVARRAPWLPPPDQPSSTRMPAQEDVCPPSSSCYFPRSGNLIGVTGSLDLTDEIVRGLGKDPNALEKARFLSATFEFRIKLAIEARKRQMKQALEDFPRYLDELWADPRYSARERRRLLYELWLEMDRTPEGSRAAQMVDRFVRTRVPCGGDEGYSRAELDGFRASHPDRRGFAAGEACFQTAGGR